MARCYTDGMEDHPPVESVRGDLDEEVARVWIEEAERRAQAMEDGSEPDIAAEEVFSRIGLLFSKRKP